jgi:hypothetical protein
MPGPRCHFSSWLETVAAGLAAMWVLYVSFEDLSQLVVVGPVEEVPLSRHAPVRSPWPAPSIASVMLPFFILSFCPLRSVYTVLAQLAFWTIK